MEYKVIIPEEKFSIMQWEDEGFPAICVANESLVDFEPKVVFGWWLSIIVDFAEQAEKGMPTHEEKIVLDQIGDEFDMNLKADGNALFYARVTVKGTRQFIYRVYDPGKANSYLMGIIESQSEKRPFDFRMEHDENWENCKFIMDTITR